MGDPHLVRELLVWLGPLELVVRAAAVCRLWRRAVKR